eukprot:GHVU01218606.1.p1 GENE.GHVU01218606.1~~GHVU01218606.1.p1  ORF type:complete len:1004 (-),score=109.13 GHVU01218606.1:721-3732(-)
MGTLSGLSSFRGADAGREIFYQVGFSDGILADEAVGSESGTLFVHDSRWGLFPREGTDGIESGPYEQLLLPIKDNAANWMDDVLLWHETQSGLLVIVELFFKLVTDVNLYLTPDPKKTNLLAKEIVWCGKLINEHGMQIDPARLETMVQWPIPETGQQLAEFMDALPWIQGNVPNLVVEAQPLRDLLTELFRQIGLPHKRKRLASVTLVKNGWTSDHEMAFRRCTEAIKQALTIAHPDRKKAFCLFTDASDTHKAAMLTQIPVEDLSLLDITKARHEPLGFHSQAFKGPAIRWSTPEKEGDSVKTALTEWFPYLVRLGESLHVFADHRALKFVLGKGATILNNPPVYVLNKLHRWALELMNFDYEVHYLEGDKNVWADMLTRWAAKTGDVVPPTAAHVRALKSWNVPFKMDPFDLEVPVDDIREAQEKDPDLRRVATQDRGDGLWYKNGDGRVYIPVGADEIKIRLITQAHSGTLCHCGMNATYQELRKRFVWIGMQDDVQEFVNYCLHCQLAKPRPLHMGYGLGVGNRALRPNHTVFADFYTMSEAATGEKKLLVLKCGWTGFTMLYACQTDDGETVGNCLADWAKHYTLPEVLSTDQGPHFKNKVVKALTDKAIIHHHFSFPYCPWSNGTAEVVNKAVKRCFQSVINTLRKNKRDWPQYVSAVTTAINGVKRRELQRMGRDGRMGPVSASEAFLPGIAAADVFSQMRAIDADVAAALAGPVADNLAEAIQESLVGGKEGQPVDQRPRFDHDDNKDAWQKIIRQAQMGAGYTRSAKAKAKLQTGQPLAHPKMHINSRKHLEKGDFVLVSLPEQFGRKLHGKLTLNWIGPFQVVDETEPFIFTVRNLIDGTTSRHHRARIRLYCEGARGDRAAMVEWVGQGLQDSIYKVEQIIDLRANEKTKHFEMEVKWLGFSNAETTWEPLATLFEDAEEHVREFLDRKNSGLYLAAKKTLPPVGKKGVPPVRVRVVRAPPARYLDPGQMGPPTEAPDDDDLWLSDAEPMS